MFIVWGKKLLRRKIGYVGDFCPICRAITLFECIDVYRASHLYFVRLSDGERVAAELECETCHTVYGRKDCSAYEKPEEGAELYQFALATSPRGRDAFLNRLQLEAQVVAGSLEPQQRRSLLAEPFYALEYYARIRQARGSQRSLESVLLVLIIIGIFFSMVLWAVGSKTWAILATAATASLVGWVLYGIIIGAGAAGSSHKVLSRLALALAPLGPTTAELEQTLAPLRQKNLLIVRRLKPLRLHAVIQREFSQP